MRTPIVSLLSFLSTALLCRSPKVAAAQGRSIGGQPLWAYYDADDFGTTYSDGVGGSMGA